MQSKASRPAVVGERLVTRDFGTGTRGFGPEDGADIAICCLPGTELAFNNPIRVYAADAEMSENKTAIFRQVNKQTPHAHHDCLEFPDGRSILLTFMLPGQIATVLQLPAAPKTKEEAEAQERVTVVA